MHLIRNVDCFGILEVINSFVEKYKIESDFAEAIINNVKERNY